MVSRDRQLRHCYVVLANICGGSRSCTVPKDEGIECESTADTMDAYFAKRADHVIFFHLKANTVEITHGYVDITSMNPPFVGMERDPFWKKPKAVDAGSNKYLGD